MRVETCRGRSQKRVGRRLVVRGALFAALLLVLASGRLASAASRIEHATVFLSGAEMTRVMRVDLKPGKNTVTFGGLPTDIRPESVGARVSGESEGAELMSAVYRVDHLAKPGASERVERLNGELKATRDEIERTADRVRLLEAEEEFLRKNSAIGGKAGIRLEELREVDEYYRARFSGIASEKFDCKRTAEELQKKHDRLTRELGSAVDDGRKSVGEISVELSSERAATVDVAVSYFVQSAGWTPFYEIRVADLNGPARLVGKGRVYQTTGEDWKDIPVVLSSGSPAIVGTQPELMPWYLDFQRPVARSQYQSFNMAMNAAPQQDMLVLEEAPPAMPMPKAAGKPVAQETQTSVEFVLPAPISVPSGSDGYTAEIMNAEMPAKYEHYSVRKLDRDVFVLAKIEGWEKLSILEGEVGIFLGNTYVGQSFIDPRRADDTLEISLGRDSGVIVTRVKGRDFAGTSFLGTSNKATREWVLTVRNTRQTPIDIRVLDQIPVSANKDIKVEAVELSGATHDAGKGELRWDLHLEPGESVQKTVKYAVTYPKDKELALE
ncbi:DUF4139 domain-containing protein [Synergistaceae bacterium OttesenSCG-928-I11]|nr:DUF4139 domain-containing protein [Synergistaceae bacterium OttesenSCG-928-I11]